jgi:hypothetical protein
VDVALDIVASERLDDIGNRAGCRADEGARRTDENSHHYETTVRCPATADIAIVRRWLL